MGVFTAGGLTGAGSTTLPISSFYGGGAASAICRLQDIQIWNPTATAVSLKLVRCTTTGTRGAAMTSSTMSAHNPEVSTGIAYQTHTVAPTMTDFGGYRIYLTAGNAVIWTFADWDLTVPAVANAGIGILVSSGTGQTCEVTWSWKE